MNFCPHCGTKTRTPEDRFCSNCGAVLQPDQRGVSAGSRMLSAFLDGCAGPADANHDGFVEWDESYRYLFQALRVSSPSTSSPLRRGELIGRVPLAVCKKL